MSSSGAAVALGGELLYWSAAGERPSMDVTKLLHKWSQGDHAALEDLVPLIYGELRRLARSYLAHESPGHTLQGTALVHEAYMRLVRQDSIEWQNRAHFFGIAAQTMRRILVEHARRRNAEKRGGGMARVSVEENEAVSFGTDIDILVLDAALEELGQLDPRRAKVVEMRFFGGLTEGEIATVLEVSEATVRRDWTLAKAWLYRKISGRKKKMAVGI